MGEVIKKRLMQQSFDSPEHEAMLNLIIVSFWLRSKIDAACKEFGITISQYNVLRILKGKYPDGYARGDIISRMLEPAPDVTRLIDKLLESRLVERFSSNEDRRRSISRITRKGIALVESLKPNLKKVESLLSNQLTVQESKKLSELCEKIYGSEL